MIARSRKERMTIRSEQLKTSPQSSTKTLSQYSFSISTPHKLNLPSVNYNKLTSSKYHPKCSNYKKKILKIKLQQTYELYDFDVLLYPLMLDPSHLKYFQIPVERYNHDTFTLV